MAAGILESCSKYMPALLEFRSNLNFKGHVYCCTLCLILNNDSVRVGLGNILILPLQHNTMMSITEYRSCFEKKYHVCNIIAFYKRKTEYLALCLDNRTSDKSVKQQQKHFCFNYTTLSPIMSISCDVNLTWQYSQLSHSIHLITIIVSRKFQYRPTLSQSWSVTNQ